MRSLITVGIFLLSLEVSWAQNRLVPATVDDYSRSIPTRKLDKEAIAPERIAGLAELGQSYNPLDGIRISDSGLSAINPLSTGFNNRGEFAGRGDTDLRSEMEIFHQPLIQVKVRIVEVVREDNLAVRSVVDFIDDIGPDSRIGAHHANQGRLRSTTSTRFPNPQALLGVSNLETGGSGGLINITTNYANYILEALGTEFSTDLITCPQVVTLNGQQVSLLSGANIPLQLGQSVLHDGTLAVQDTFYKHVGTYLTVTPRIISWGPRGVGRGQRPITAREIKYWNQVAETAWRIQRRLHEILDPIGNSVAGCGDRIDYWRELVRVLSKHDLFPSQDVEDSLAKYLSGNRLLTLSDQRIVLDAVNDLDRSTLLALVKEESRIQGQELIDYLSNIDLNGWDADLAQEFASAVNALRSEFMAIESAIGSEFYVDGHPCGWEPSECTLDIELVLRQSTAGESTALNLASDTPDRSAVNLTNEEVGAAIANVVQLKSGSGAVIAGLIGQRAIRTTTKVPVLGDLPIVGAAFRANATNRQSTEIVIFLEAEILPSDSVGALEKASADFQMTSSYLQPNVLNNPLELGMQRAGFGSYLPPRTISEKTFWSRYCKGVQKAGLAAHDILK